MKKLILSLAFLFPFTLIGYSQQDSIPIDPNLMAFELDSLVAQLKPTGRPWLPFIQGQNVLTGLYMLKAGAEDRQRPHDTDEEL